MNNSINYTSSLQAALHRSSFKRSREPSATLDDSYSLQRSLKRLRVDSAESSRSASPQSIYQQQQHYYNQQQQQQTSGATSPPHRTFTHHSNYPPQHCYGPQQPILLPTTTYTPATATSNTTSPQHQQAAGQDTFAFSDSPMKQQQLPQPAPASYTSMNQLLGNLHRQRRTGRKGSVCLPTSSQLY